MHSMNGIGNRKRPREDDNDEEIVCRVCFDSGGDMVAPCACDGSQKHIHVECLAKWHARVAERAEIAGHDGLCPTCKHPDGSKVVAWRSRFDVDSLMHSVGEARTDEHARELVALIYTATRVPTLRRRASEVRGIEVLASVMKAHSSDALLQSCILSIVHRLVLEDSENGVERVINAGVVQLTVEAMRTHPTDARSNSGYLHFVEGMARRSARCARIAAKAGAVELMISAIHTHADNVNVVHNGIAALHSLMWERKDTTAEAVGKNALERIACAMDDHAGDNEITHLSFAVFVEVLRNGDCKLPQHVLESVCRACVRHATDCVLATRGLQILQAVTDKSAASRVKVVAAGLGAAAKAVMNEHAKNNDDACDIAARMLKIVERSERISIKRPLL